MKTKTLTIFIISLFLTLNVFAQDKDSLALKGVEYIHQEKFDEAIAEFKKIIELDPDDPGAYMFIAVSFLAISNDYRNPSYYKKFEEYIDLAIQKGEKKMESGNYEAYDFLYLGGSYGYRGIYRSFSGDWWKAFWDGGKARKILKKGLEMDSTCYDIYFGLGAYNFYRSIKSKILWWLPFFGDNRQKGIDQTKLAIQKGKLTRDEAKYGLLRIYVENEQYDSALAVAEDLKKIKPDDPFLLWYRGEAQIKRGMHKNALENYRTLLGVLEKSKYSAPRGIVECRYQIAYLHQIMGEKEEALEEVKNILKYENEGEADDYIKDFIKKAVEIKKSIQTHKQT